MSYNPHDTIAAIASTPGGAARSIVRLSGHSIEKGVRNLFRADHALDAFPITPSAIPGTVEILLDGAPRSLACDLFLWPTNRSYTREPVAEFHTFGSPPLVRAILEAACRAGARLAEPGEFTLRAFLAGRLDLTQAEAVLGVIDAHGASELNTAVEQLAGNLARPLHRLRDELVALLAELEAGLDFVEEDIEFISADELTSRLQTIAAQLADVAEQMSARLTATSSRQIVLIGPPNAGKSSLFNALARRFSAGTQRTTPAIVSNVRGTTRDYLAATVDLHGHRCELIDTAGIEQGEDSSTISRSAQSHAARERERALIRILCIDAASQDAALVLSAAHTALPTELIALTKTDLASPPSAVPNSIAVSSVTGAGLDTLASEIAKRLAATPSASRHACVATTADRCRDSVRLADAAVARAADLAAQRGGDELIAVEIRTALTELGKIVGAIYTDDILDRIFKTFCIGK